jgi:hypothetical protein
MGKGRKWFGALYPGIAEGRWRGIYYMPWPAAGVESYALLLFPLG